MTAAKHSDLCTLRDAAQIVWERWEGGEGDEPLNYAKRGAIRDLGHRIEGPNAATLRHAIMDMDTHLIAPPDVYYEPRDDPAWLLKLHETHAPYGPLMTEVRRFLYWTFGVCI